MNISHQYYQDKMKEIIYDTDKRVSLLIESVNNIANYFGYIIDRDGRISEIPNSFGNHYDFKEVSSKIDILENILKEAGIMVTPPKNISIPDPRGYSVNKIKI